MRDYCAIIARFLNFEEIFPNFKQLAKAVDEFCPSIVNNDHLIPNYEERYRYGEAIAMGFIGSTMHRVVSKRFCQRQQMQWSRVGVYLLLQTRLMILNHNCELGSVFKRWYSDMQVAELAEAA